MLLNKNIIIQFFRYLWIAIAAVIILFILSQAIYTKRSLEYYLDFSKPLTKDIRGWYPEQRLVSTSISSLAGAYDVVAEPLYMKIYSPISFDTLNIEGTIQGHALEDIRLGLKQIDGSWDWQQVDLANNPFSNTFDLSEAQRLNNQLEIILSIPAMENPNRVSLINNWKIILSR